MKRFGCGKIAVALAAATLAGAAAQAQDPNVNRKVDLDQVVAKRPSPEPIPEVPLGPTLPTHPIPRGQVGPNWTVCEATPLPRDRSGIWVLEFAFKPVRIIDVALPGQGRKKIYYMCYRVVNRTGEPRMFVPQFTLVTDTGKRVDDVPLEQAVENVRAREEPAKARDSVLGAVTVMGYVPPSVKEGIDDAVYGVAIWDKVDPNADAFKVFVRGLSDGYTEVQPPGDTPPYTRYKAVRVDFTRPGDNIKTTRRRSAWSIPPTTGPTTPDPGAKPQPPPGVPPGQPRSRRLSFAEGVAQKFHGAIRA